MIFNINCESREGFDPKKYGRENQDAFAIDYTGRECCLCMADGAGSKRYSALGAKWLVHDICGFMMQNAGELFTSDEETIHKRLDECIKHSLDKTSRLQRVELSELASTLICVLTDGRDYLIVHLGDGCVTAERGGYFNVLSFPQNGAIRQSTALTTMPAAGKYLRIQKGSCSDISIFWVMTDGAMAEIFERNYGLNGEKLSMPMIRRRLANGSSDDATYGYITWNTDERITKIK